MADMDDDILDPELLAKQRRLLVKITKGAMQKAFLGWKNLNLSLRSKKDAERRMSDYKAILDTAPFNRTKDNIKLLSKLVEDVPFFASLPETVRLNAAQQLRPVPLHNSELTFAEKDYRSLYLVVVGTVEAICDTFYMADHALFQEEEEKNESRPLSKEGVEKSSGSAAGFGTSLFKAESMDGSTAEKSEKNFDLRDTHNGEAPGSCGASIVATSIHEDFLLDMEENELSVRDMKAMLKTSTSTSTHVQYVVIKEGGVFTGRHLDIRNFEKESSGHAPPKILAACTPEHRSCMLLKLYQDDLIAAVKGRIQAAVQYRVDFCCRIPVFRWSPFKELHQLATNVTEKVFQPGSSIVVQGKESTHIHVVLQGEVGIFADLTEKTGNQTKDIAPKSFKDAFKDMILAKHDVQHALLAMRGPGSIIGDDCLRDRYMAVGAVAKTPVRTMMITMQKFKLCIDILTLNRMSNFRPQFTEGEQMLVKEHIREANIHGLEVAEQRHSLLESALGREHVVVRPVEASVKAWKPNGGRGGGKSIQSFEGIVDPKAINPNKKVPVKADVSRMLDLDHFGLIAAANTLGLSSPSMGRFLASVKEQVAKEQAEIKKKQAVDKKNTLGFAVPEEQKANVMNEEWIDCRDYMEEKAQGQRYTEMMETAVILVVEILALPGQGDVDLKQLCRACDEARIKWGASATGRGLQLTRWSTTRWFLCSSLGDLGLKHRPVVREVADCGLEMQAAWSQIMKEQKLLFHTFSAGLVVGPAFVTYDGGKFLSGLGGRAFDTALDLLEEARKVDPCSCIMVTDACVEALRHTHTLYLEGTNYRLSNAMKMPFDYTAGQLIGQAVDFDPVSPGPTTRAAMPNRFSTQMRSQGRAQPTPRALTRSGSRQSTSHVTTTPRRASARGNTPPSASLKGPMPPPKSAPSPKKSGLSITVPAPAEASSINSNALIGYGPNAIVTPGNFGKPFHTEASHLTQPSNAGKLVKQKSLKSLRQALESDMPLTPGGTVLAPWDSPVNDGTVAATNAAARAGDKGRRQSHAPGSRHSRFNSRPKSKQGADAKADNVSTSPLAVDKSFGSIRSVSTATTTLKTPVATIGNMRHSNLNTTAPMSSDTHKSKIPTNGRPSRGPPSATITSELSGYKPHPIHGQTVRNQSTKLNARQLARQIMGTTAPTPVSSSNIFGDSQTLTSSMQMQSTTAFRIVVPQDRARAGYSNLTVALSPLTITPTSSGPASSKTPVRSHPSTTLPSLRRNDPAANHQQETTDSRNARTPPKAKIAATPSRNVMFSAEHYDEDDEEDEVPDILEADGDGFGLDYAPGHTTVTMGPDDGFWGENQSPRNDEGLDSDLVLAKEDSTSTVGTQDGPDPHPGADVHRGAAAARSRHLREAASTMDTLRVSKDCGSLRGAQDYVSSMPSGTMVLIMSVAGQAELPDMGHLGYLEMLAASYNRIVKLPKSRIWAPHSKLQNLVLSHNEITELPPHMFSHMPNLLEVNLGANKIKELPPSLFSLAHLQVLCLSRNELTELPASIAGLVSLQQLFAAHNALAEVPAELGSMTELIALDLASNQLKHLPDGIANLSRLVNLNLKSNLLSELPVGMMSGMPNLQRLNLGRNAFRELWSEETKARYAEMLVDIERKVPMQTSKQVDFNGEGDVEETPRDWLGSVASYASSASDDFNESRAMEAFITSLKPVQIMLGMATPGDPYVAFPRLRVINLSHNKLKSIPEWIPPNLKELHLSFNRIGVLPEWLPLRLWLSLRVLDVHHNGISALPKSFYLFKQLEMFGLNDNPFVAPASDAVATAFLKGTTAMDLVKMSKVTPLSKLRGITMMMSSTIGLGHVMKARRDAEAANAKK